MNIEEIMDFWSEYSELINVFVSLFFYAFIFLAIFLFTKIKKVPANTTIIIDRDTHFYKKKKYGYYFFNQKRDRVTTMISTSPVIQIYSNIFKTHDDMYFNLKFCITYKATNVDMVLSSLEDSRRSIYDIANCAVETVVATLTGADFIRGTVRKDMFFKQLESMLEPFYIDATAFELLHQNSVTPSYGATYKFNKHVSSSNNPFGRQSNTGDYDIEDYADDPFKPL